MLCSRAMRSIGILVAIVLTACGGSKQPASSGSGGGGGSSTSAPSGGGESTGAGESTAEGAKETPAAPAAPAEKMDPALPETKDAKAFPRRYECPPKGANLAKLVPDTMTAQLEKDAPVFMFEVVMTPKVSLMIPKHAGVDTYGLLLDGEVSVLSDDIPDKGHQKRAWKLNGFRAPGSGINIYSKEPTRMILAFVVAGSSGTLAEQIDKIGKDKTIVWGKRSSPVAAFELGAVQPTTWGGGAYHARIALQEPPAAMSFLMMSKNAPVAEHSHDKEWEYLAIVEGEGELVKKTGGKTAISGSTFASINPGNPHSFKPAGTKPTVAVQLYWPPGPEQRFKKLAEGSK